MDADLRVNSNQETMSSREPPDQDDIGRLIDDLTVTETLPTPMDDCSILFDTSLDEEVDDILFKILCDKECPDQLSISEDSTGSSADSEIDWWNLIEESLIMCVPPQEVPPVKTCRHCKGLIALPALLPKTGKLENLPRVPISSCPEMYVKRCETPACCFTLQSKNSLRKGKLYKKKEKGAIKANQVQSKASLSLE